MNASLLRNSQIPKKCEQIHEFQSPIRIDGDCEECRECRDCHTNSPRISLEGKLEENGMKSGSDWSIKVVQISLDKSLFGSSSKKRVSLIRLGRCPSQKNDLSAFFMRRYQEHIQLCDLIKLEQTKKVFGHSRWRPDPAGNQTLHGSKKFQTLEQCF